MNEREDISNSAVAKLTTKERHKYTQSSGDGGADGWLPLGSLPAWEEEEEEEEAMDGKLLLSRFEKMTWLPRGGSLATTRRSHLTWLGGLEKNEEREERD